MTIRSCFLFLMSIAIALSLVGITPIQSAHASTLTVNTLNDEIDGSCVDGDCSLRDAIFVSGSSGDVITFSVTGTLPLTLGQLSIGKDITINGPGTELLTISGEDTSRVFFINNSTSIVTITGLTIANGKVTDDDGGGIKNHGILTLDHVTIDNNTAASSSSLFSDGGGIHNTNTLTITNSLLINNVSNFTGGAISDAGVSLNISNTTINDNFAEGIGGGGTGGGIASINSGSITLDSVSITSNIAKNAAAMYINNVTQFEMSNSLVFSNDALDNAGGVWLSGTTGNYTIRNSTISKNRQTISSSGQAGGLWVDGVTASLNHVTIVNNIVTGTGGGAGIFTSESAVLNVQNSLIALNTSSNSNDEDCNGTINSLDYNLIQDADGNCTITGTTTNNITGLNPLLNPLADNGGATKTHALQIDSPALNAIPGTVNGCGTIFTTDQRGISRPQEDNCEIGAYEHVIVPDNIQTYIGETLMGSYGVLPGDNIRDSYAGANNGPVKAIGLNSLPIIASERVAYTPDGGATWTSFDEMMGLPSNQLTDTYYFPFYNNVEMNTQLRFGNVGTSNTVVTVTIGGVVQGSYFVIPNQSMRLSYSLNSGPVKVQSSGNVPIISSIRFANIESTSPLVVPAFTEMMGLPGNQLTTTYIFPHYNNVEMNTQLRFGNVGTSATNVTVTIGGVVQGVYPVAPSQSVRLFYNLNSGPVKVQSSGGVPIIASMRFANIESESPLVISYFSEMLGLPQASLSTNYWFPIYDNVTHNMQLRFGNMGTTSTTVTVRIGGVEQGSYVVLPNQSQRLFYTLNDGPVQVQSSGGIPIIASIRFAFIESESPLVVGAFSEMLGLPASQLSSTYLFPFYNNAELDTQMRIAVP